MVNIEKLITVIQKQTILYDTSNKDYYDRIKRKQMWEDVCASLHPSWDTADENEKVLYGKEVQRKWQSLRDCFRRELIQQKNPSLSGAKKKTKYKYFDHLGFLTPYTQSVSCDPQDQEGAIMNDSINEESSSSKDPLAENESSRKRKRSYVEEEIFTPKEETIRDGGRFFDDDEAFLLSLLPGFKEYSWEEKCQLRIEIMKTILKFKQAQKLHRPVSLTMKCEVEDEDSM